MPRKERALDFQSDRDQRSVVIALTPCQCANRHYTMIRHSQITRSACGADFFTRSGGCWNVDIPYREIWWYTLSATYILSRDALNRYFASYYANLYFLMTQHKNPLYRQITGLYYIKKCAIVNVYIYIRTDSKHSQRAQEPSRTDLVVSHAFRPWVRPCYQYSSDPPCVTRFSLRKIWYRFLNGICSRFDADLTKIWFQGFSPVFRYPGGYQNSLPISWSGIWDFIKIKMPHISTGHLDYLLFIFFTCCRITISLFVSIWHYQSPISISTLIFLSFCLDNYSSQLLSR